MFFQEQTPTTQARTTPPPKICVTWRALRKPFYQSDTIDRVMLQLICLEAKSPNRKVGWIELSAQGVQTIESLSFVQKESHVEHGTRRLGKEGPMSRIRKELSERRRYLPIFTSRMLFPGPSMNASQGNTNYYYLANPVSPILFTIPATWLSSKTLWCHRFNSRLGSVVDVTKS